MNLSQTFNLVEVFLWSTIGIVFLVKSRKAKWRSRTILIGILFIAFGMSDAVELQTGAWWRPWWLFVWNAICVVSLTAFGIRRYKESARVKSETSAES